MDVVFVTIVAFGAIWTVMGILLIKAVFRFVAWLETQKLSGEYRKYYGTVPESTHESVESRGTRVDDPDEAIALQEKVALETAKNRNIDYEGVESNLGTLGDEIVEEDNSLDIVEKLRKMENANK